MLSVETYEALDEGAYLACVDAYENSYSGKSTSYWFQQVDMLSTAFFLIQHGDYAISRAHRHLYMTTMTPMSAHGF